MWIHWRGYSRVVFVRFLPFSAGHGCDANMWTGSSWYAAFAFWIVGAIFFVWMFIMASAVGRGVYEPVR